MSKIRLTIGLLLLAMSLIGCSAGVNRANITSKDKFCCTVENPVGKVELSLTEEGKKSLTENLKFDPDELKRHIERALSANSLMAQNNQQDYPILGVEIKDIRVRSNFSAVMWGFMAGTDHITGDIIVKDKAGNEIDRFEVSASYALGGLAGGQDQARMGWLYEAFAKETVTELTKPR